MKTISVRELNRSTAKVVDAVEHGETFELIRSGKVVAYLTRTLPPPGQTPDWKAHFAKWRRRQPEVSGLIKELEEERRRLRAREKAME